MTTPRSRWLARSSVGEGLANLRDGAALGAALVLVFAVTVGLTSTADLSTVSRILRTERTYLDSGGDLLVAERQDGQVDAAACVALEGIPGVRTAVAVSVAPGALTLQGRPESQQTVVTATAGAIGLLGLHDLGSHDVVVSRIIADRWQWAPGAHLAFDTKATAVTGAPLGVLDVADVADLALLGDAASTGVLLLRTPTGRADTCYVRIEPQYRADLSATIPAALGETADSPIRVSDRLPIGALAQDPAMAFAERPTRPVGALSGAILGMLWAIVAWTRRGRAALYTSLGVPYADGVLIRWTEGAGVVILGVLWGTALAISGAISVGGLDPNVALELGVRHGALAAGVGLGLVVLVGLWRPSTIAALKDR